MKRSEVLNVLNLVKSGIASKDIVESMTYFFLNNDKVITYNDQICVQHPFDFGFSCFVKASDFQKILTRLKTDELTFNLKEDKLNIKCGRSNINLATIKDTEIVTRIKKVNKSLEDVKWNKISSNFIEALSLCSFSASTNESQNTLTYIYVNGKKVHATNNAQLAIVDMDSKMDEMFIKATAVKDIASLDPVSYAVTKSWIHFKNKNKCIFSVRTIKGEFPNIDKIFNKVDSKAILFPDDMAEGIDITSVLADEENPLIHINITKGKCNISVESEHGSINHSCKMKYKGEDISFQINPAFLEKMLAHSSSIKVEYPIAMIESKNFKIATALMG